ILIDIATAASNSTVDLHTSVFITCSQACDSEAVLHIPNSIVALSRPAVHVKRKIRSTCNVMKARN
ncbi:hypothetical protein C8R48DRAFT_728248, partial [Suillus tomentosus]